MGEFNIIPKKSVNGLLFNTNRENVRNKLGDYREFKKTKFSKNTSDIFKGCHVYYDEYDKFVAIEIFKESTVKINGKKIFPGNFNSVVNALNELDSSLEITDDSCTSKSLSISVYAPGKKIMSITCGKAKYFSINESTLFENDIILDTLLENAISNILLEDGANTILKASDLKNYKSVEAEIDYDGNKNYGYSIGVIFKSNGESINSSMHIETDSQSNKKGSDDDIVKGIVSSEIKKAFKNQKINTRVTRLKFH